MKPSEIINKIKEDYFQKHKADCIHHEMECFNDNCFIRVGDYKIRAIIDYLDLVAENEEARIEEFKKNLKNFKPM